MAGKFVGFVGGFGVEGVVGFGVLGLGFGIVGLPF